MGASDDKDIRREMREWTYAAHRDLKQHDRRREARSGNPEVHAPGRVASEAESPPPSTIDGNEGHTEITTDATTEDVLAGL